jgi:formylglycine-generating enzyme required for sulfatase activity
MPFDLQTWKASLRQRLPGWKLRMTRLGVNSVYATISAAALWPVVEAAQRGEWAALAALGGVVGSVGGNLLANQIQEWKDEASAATQLAQAIPADPALRAELDAVLARLDALAAAREALPQADHAWLADNLHAELARLGSNLTYEATAQDNAVIAQGPGAIAVGKGGVSVGTVKGNVIKEGDGKREIHAQQYVEKQYVGAGSGGNTAADDAAAKTDRARRRYLERLRRQCHALPLAALGGAESDDHDLTLDQVYIDLNTTTRVPDKEGKHETDRRGAPDALRPDEETRPLPALDAARQTPRLVLLGDPGAGKSSFVRMMLGWQAAALLGEAPDPAPGCAADLIPILLVLRDLIPRLECFDPAALPSDRRDETLAATVRAQLLDDLRRLEAEEFAPALCEALLDGRCLLALDGLDEVPLALRGCVRQTVTAVLARYRPQRVIVTCRVRSYSGEAVQPGFAAHTLAPFDEERIRRFATGWYAAQKTLGRVDADQAKARGDDLANAALTAELRELSANPMMLTAMAIVHQAEHQLPPERVCLYKVLVDVLLRRWQQRKTGEARLAPSDLLDRFLKDELRLHAAVERLAYEAHRVGRERDKSADLGRGQALTLLEDPMLLGDPGLAGEFLDYVDQRAGLLVGQGGDPAHPTAYAFPHRTIQEYLAGCYLVSQREAGRAYLAHAAEGDTWSLAALYGAEELHYNRRLTRIMLDLAYRLCPDRQPVNMQDWRTILWSGQMAALAGRETLARDAAAPDGDPTYLVRLLPRLVAALAGPLPAIERAEAGRALARLGDPRPEVMNIDDMQFCFIPAGPFLMGGDKNPKDPESEYDDGPQHQLELPAYCIGRFPVTQAQFAAFVADDGYGQAAYWQEAQATGVWRDGVVQRRVWRSIGEKSVEEHASRPFDYGASFSLPNHPVVGITWYEMLAFTRWLTKRWRAQRLLPGDWQVTLPSEAEWEKAARGGLQIPAQPVIFSARQGIGNAAPAVGWNANPDPRRVYPWIGAFAADRANVGESGIDATNAVGCFPAGAGPYAAQDLAGNVWEWTRSLHDDYPYPARGKEREKHERLDASTSAPQVLRGGAFYIYRSGARCAFRSGLNPDYRNDSVGFRVVVSPIRL